MTPAEFKAWFDGFTEAFTGCPTKAQWGRIKERVGEIDGKAVTERVYVDRYIDRYWRNYGGANIPYWSAIGVGVCSSAQNLADVGSNHYRQVVSANAVSNTFNGLAAMNALGRAEASAL